MFPSVYVSDIHFEKLFEHNVINGIYGSVERGLNELIGCVYQIQKL